MSDLEVRIVRLEPMRVVSFHTISKSPEVDAWEIMSKWAKPKGLLDDPENHPLFGFNNPNPSKGKKEYGYEYWIKVNPLFETEDDIEVIDYKGGLFAVTKCDLRAELKSEFFKNEGYLESWRKLCNWIKSSKYDFGNSPCFEHHLDPRINPDQWIFDLYYPIKES